MNSTSNAVTGQSKASGFTGPVSQRFTVWALEPNEAGEQRWAVGKNGPRAYLTCDEETAKMICRGMNTVELLK